MARDGDQLADWIAGGCHCIAMQTFEEDYAVDILASVADRFQRTLYVWSADVGLRVHEGLAESETSTPVAALNYLRQLATPPLAIFLDLAPHLSNEVNLRTFRAALRDISARGGCFVLIDHSDQLPPVVRAHAADYEITFPDEEELEQILRETLRGEHQRANIDIDITRSQLQAIVRNLRGLTRRQAVEVIRSTVLQDRKFDAEDIDAVLEKKRRMFASGGLLTFVSTPADINKIGGLLHLKNWLRQRERSFSDDAREFGIEAPRGVLLLGVQGAGKSLCAKAIATGWQRPLVRMEVGALYDRYVGESERRLRDALHQAESMAPIILWIDEVEKAFASAAAQSTDGGLSQRMFGTLLTWMQEHTAPVFLVATANNIDALPPELLRKGRFDEIFFVDLPSDNARREIFAIHLRKRDRDPADFDLAALSKASEGYSGAEIEQAIVSAMHDAFAAMDQLTTEGIVKSLENSPPLSVTMADRVAALRRWAADRCVAAG